MGKAGPASRFAVTNNIKRENIYIYVYIKNVIKSGTLLIKGAFNVNSRGLPICPRSYF